jgi:hypothetical protein
MLVNEIGSYLEAFGSGSLGLTVGTNLFEMPFPTTAPDACVGLEAYGGQPSSFTLGAQAGVVTPPPDETVFFHVFIRGSRDGALTAATLARKIRAALDGLLHATLSGVFYLDVRSLHGAPMFLNYDKNQRPLWALDFQAEKQISPS